MGLHKCNALSAMKNVKLFNNNENEKELFFARVSWEDLYIVATGGKLPLATQCGREEHPEQAVSSWSPSPASPSPWHSASPIGLPARWDNCNPWGWFTSGLPKNIWCFLTWALSYLTTVFINKTRWGGGWYRRSGWYRSFFPYNFKFRWLPSEFKACFC